MTSKKSWLLDAKLIPLFQQLVDSYYIRVREEWNVKVEETNIDITQVKEEPLDDNLVEPLSLQVNSNTTNVS